MKRRRLNRLCPVVFGTLFAIMAVGCIHNDIPYPRIQANITSLVVEGQSQPVLIDTIERIATVYLDEQTDIASVPVISCSVGPEGAHFVGDSIEGRLDLSRPRVFMVELYQMYDWTVKAVQNIDRYFTVAGQIGTTTIDVPGRRIVVTLPETLNLSSVKVTSAKLGPAGSTTSPELIGATVDLTHPLDVAVTAYGRTEYWTVYARSH